MPKLTVKHSYIIIKTNPHLLISLVGLMIALSAITTFTPSVSAVSSISVAAPASIDLEIIPTADGASTIGTGIIRISASNTGGYDLYLSTKNDTSLHSSHHSNIITSIKSKATLSQFANNTWGYTITSQTINDKTVFSPPTTTANAAVISQPAATSDDTYQMALGVNTDTSLPAGVYGNTLVISVVAKPAKVFSGITYMQEMSPDICINATENDTARLIDKRDGKSYWVAKLKDGNCWMTQNLALDITEDGLKVSDTDITEDWNQNSPYPPKVTSTNLKFLSGFCLVPYLILMALTLGIMENIPWVLQLNQTNAI